MRGSVDEFCEDFHGDAVCALYRVPMIAKLDEITSGLEQQPEFLTPDYVMSASYRACRFAPPEGMTLEEEGILNTRCQLDLGHLALGQASLVRHIEAAR